MKLISQADVVIALGSRMAVRHPAAARHGLLAQGRQDHPGRGRPHHASGWSKITVGIHGDAKAAAALLGQRRRAARWPATPPRPSARQDPREGRLGEGADGWTHERDPYSLDMIAERQGRAPFNGGVYLHPRQVLRELEGDAAAVMVSTDIGNINSVANSYLRFEEPRSFFAPMSFGNCGYALPTIIGAKVAAPDRPAIAYAGDGAWAMSMVRS